jgi:MFS family permease
MSVDTPLRPSRFRGPLGSAPYRFLVAGSTINSLGNSITPVALAFGVLELGGTASELGIVVAAYALAEVVTLLFGGVLGDRLPRQLLMQGAATGAAVTQGVIAAALIGGWATITLLGLVGLLNGCLSALSGPSSQAMTRQTVPAELLPSAVALRRLGQNTAGVVGYAIAGMLVAAFGAGWAIALDALTFVAAAICFALIRVPAVVAAADRLSVLGDLWAGAVEVFRHTWLWLLIGQALLYHLFYGGVQGVLGPIVVGDEFGRAAWGWALALLMAGFMVGGLVTLRWKPRRGLAVGTVLLALTACFPAAMAWTDQLPVLLLGAFLHGFGLEIFSVNWDLSIQTEVAEDKLARVYAFDIVGSFVARPVGLVLVGPITALTGIGPWLVAVAAIMAGSSLLAAMVPSVRRLERR